MTGMLQKKNKQVCSTSSLHKLF